MVLKPNITDEWLKNHEPTQCMPLRIILILNIDTIYFFLDLFDDRELLLEVADDLSFGFTFGFSVFSGVLSGVVATGGASCWLVGGSSLNGSGFTPNCRSRARILSWDCLSCASIVAALLSAPWALSSVELLRGENNILYRIYLDLLNVFKPPFCTFTLG